MPTLNRIGRRERHVTFYDGWDGTRPVDFVGRPDSAAPSPESIEEVDLGALIASGTAGVRDAIVQALGLTAPVWMLVGELRSRVFPNDRGGKPGDFDIIVGERGQDRPAFDRLALVELKRSRVRADGKTKNPSGLGTTQAWGAAALGFDRVLLVHLVLGPDEVLRTPAGKAATPDYAGAARRVLGRVRRADARWRERPYGLLVVEWARAPGANLRTTGAIAATLATTARRLVVNVERRTQLEAHLRKLLPSDACPDTMFVCGTCGTVSCECRGPR